MPAVSLISLGCPKNLIDSERALSGLAENGFVVTARTDEADVVIVNTCGFIESAKEESIETLLEAARPDARGRRPIVIATGCLAERYAPELAREMPEIDAFLGLGEYSRLPQVAHALLRGRPEHPEVHRGPLPLRPQRAKRSFRLTPRHYAYLRISEGCDNPCTFCSIPDIRGRFTSKPSDEVIAEARALVEDGCRELILVAQDLTDYGLDIEGRRALPELLERLDEESGARWIRCMYLYPAHLEGRMLEAVRDLPNVTPYLDIPIQHASTAILRRMARRMTTESTRELIERIRDVIPGVALRTSIIVGFPGETEEDHEILLDFLETTRIDRLGTFTYSDEEGTPSYRLEGKLDAETIARRFEEVMSLQQEIAFDQAASSIGTHKEVLVDSANPENPGRWIARTASDCPEIDPVVHLESDLPVDPGEFVNVQVTGSDGYDLQARRTDTPPAIT